MTVEWFSIVTGKQNKTAFSFSFSFFVSSFLLFFFIPSCTERPLILTLIRTLTRCISVGDTHTVNAFSVVVVVVVLLHVSLPPPPAVYRQKTHTPNQTKNKQMMRFGRFSCHRIGPTGSPPPSPPFPLSLSQFENFLSGCCLSVLWPPDGILPLLLFVGLSLAQFVVVEFSVLCCAVLSLLAKQIFHFTFSFYSIFPLLCSALLCIFVFVFVFVSILFLNFSAFPNFPKFFSSFRTVLLSTAWISPVYQASLEVI
ncbi:hypothetical protein Kpol_1028p65 [Vanderwaltozyma polyspora DSM 70294]|uniref:Uncharacterized protein n=1 Tax=Vanderwaltozyma polyspora (strain ATCC 22028 / DSM 70294 / BCRC 21397 / CBS 2163 / NBRC 10782 / NRRL Y-8283 / UCD 57-17) TaxID=436907 RepID=A7TG33_VANPO|nr:uncharacterized protein Kpol_1028p65 [Vanderwaltozyma polyspora DSM 70294]EDO18790.1 hypothetical protein Kpol_1028p65 [Vanderwaltozyma polyspora DSM 70294]